MRTRLISALFASACFAVGAASVQSSDAATHEVKIVADDIGGLVKSAKGPEAGVWVIAETTDLPTRFVKIVVTDDQGRYVLPELPKAKYKVWVRGYGLVDSQPVEATPGRKLDLTAVVAPDAKTAAQYYPAEYWFALAKIPPVEGNADEFTARMKTGCMACHQLGDQITRTIPPATTALGTFKTSLDAWDRRTRSGPAGGAMSGSFLGLGDERKLFADWTDDIAAGNYPKKSPGRPAGVERNVVVTMWDWANATSYSHDSAASDVRDPTINANGLVYGPSQWDDYIMYLDPKKNAVGTIKVPSEAIPVGMSNKDGSNFAKSPIWGDEPIWKASAQPRSSAIDQKGRAWISAEIRPPNQQPDFCKAGSSNKFAQWFPVERSGKGVAFYDPKTQQVAGIDTCFTTDHNQFASAKVVPGNSVFYGAGGDGFGWFGIGWVSADAWDKTHNAEASQGWIPAVLDTNGDGKITKGWTKAGEPIDPAKDRQVKVNCYSIAVSPADGSVWCSGIGGNKLTRFSLGANPPETMMAEQYSPPANISDVPFLTEGGVDVDADGVVYQGWRGSDQITAFDRRKCKVLNGPTATGAHCPEGWASYRSSAHPTFQNSKIDANMGYLIDVDREGVMGLGKGAVVSFPVGSNAMEVLTPATNTWVLMNVPYPMGYMGRNVNFRIDNPKAGWKGEAMWSSYSNMGIWHIEGGKGAMPKAVKFQLRPDPLAN